MKSLTLVLMSCILLQSIPVKAQISNVNAVNPSNTIPVHVNPTPRIIDPRIQNITFTFSNVYEYGNCLDVLLLSYEGRIEQVSRTLAVQKDNYCAQQVFNTFGNNLTRDQMLQLVELANFRATALLDKKIFPSYGLRRRVAMELGYIYEIDFNDLQMLDYLKLAPQNSW